MVHNLYQGPESAALMFFHCFFPPITFTMKRHARMHRALAKIVYKVVTGLLIPPSLYLHSIATILFKRDE